MRIGKFTDGEPTIRFNLNLKCIQCGKSVPGGLIASENYFGSYGFLLEIDALKKTYFCGKCRDKKRIFDNLS